MTLYVGLDVSQKATEICVVDADGARVWRGQCATDPETIASTLARYAPGAARVGMETGPLAIGLWHGLRCLGIPVDSIHARHVVAALSLQVNTNDATGSPRWCALDGTAPSASSPWRTAASGPY